MRYQFTIDFDCDEDSYMEHVAETLQGLLASFHYIVDNVDINYYVYEDESDES